MAVVAINSPQTCTKIYGAVQANADRFGSSLAASDSYLAVGSSGVGSIHIFEKGGMGVWNEVAHFTNGGAMGATMSLKGDTLVVGGHLYDGNTGRVWIYKRIAGTWTLVQEIDSPHPTYPAYFGRSVAVSDDGGVIIVGQPANYTVNRQAYAYHYDSGTGLYSLHSLIGTSVSSTFYGASVQVSGNGSRAFVGCNGHNSNRGRVYIYDYDIGTDTWLAPTVIDNPDNVATDHFGLTLGVCGVAGNLLAISAPGQDEAGPDWGALYIYEYTGGVWTLVQKLLPSNRVRNIRVWVGAYSSATDTTPNVDRKLVFIDEEDLLVPSLFDRNCTDFVHGSLSKFKADSGGWGVGYSEANIVGLSPGNNNWFGTCTISEGKVLVSRLQDDNPVAPNRGVVYEVEMAAFGVSAAPDTTPPTITLVSPVHLSMINPHDPIVIDVTDDVDLRHVEIRILLSGGITETVFDGNSYLGNYVYFSTRTLIAGGWRYTIRRNLGWTSKVNVTVDAIDTSGNKFP